MPMITATLSISLLLTCRKQYLHSSKQNTYFYSKPGRIKSRSCIPLLKILQWLPFSFKAEAKVLGSLWPHSTLTWMRHRHPLLWVEAALNQGAQLEDWSTGWILASIHLLTWVNCPSHNCIQKPQIAPVMTLTSYMTCLCSFILSFPDLTSYSSHSSAITLASLSLLDARHARASSDLHLLFLHQEHPYT